MVRFFIGEILFCVFQEVRSSSFLFSRGEFLFLMVIYFIFF